LRLLNMLASRTRSRLALLTPQNNSQGTIDMGCTPDYYPGYQSITDSDVTRKFEKGWRVELTNLEPPSPDILADLKAGKFKAILIFGEDLTEWDSNDSSIKKALENTRHVVVADMFRNETTKYAQLLLPMSSFAETSGSFTNGLRGINPVRKAIDPVSGYEFWKVLPGVAAELGLRYKFDFNSMEDLQTEIKHLLPTHAKVEFDTEMPGIPWNLQLAHLPISSDTALLREKPVTYENRSLVMANTVRRWFQEYWKSIGLKE
jgi:predicted molibdopterin-dependent oxidoreductase YjgC